MPPFLKMPPASSEEANSDKMILKRIRKERHARCFLKLLKEMAIKAVAEAGAFQDASDAFLCPSDEVRVHGSSSFYLRRIGFRLKSNASRQDHQTYYFYCLEIN